MTAEVSVGEIKKRRTFAIISHPHCADFCVEAVLERKTPDNVDFKSITLSPLAAAA
jgi:hypothetical protein